MNPKSGYSDHWFFGNGMVHGINIQNGRASYKNRYVKTPYYEDDMDMMSSSFDLKGFTSKYSCNSSCWKNINFRRSSFSVGNRR